MSYERKYASFESQKRGTPYLGKEIKTLVDDQLKEAGFYNVIWDGKNDQQRQVAGGIYFYQLRIDTNEFLETKKMILIK